MKYHGDDLEDRFVHRFFDLPEKGVFVDVGAADGIKGSNTYFFEKLGWTGICIEADSRNIPSLLKYRKRHRLAVVSNSDKNKVPFYLNNKDTDVSGMIRNEANSDFVEYLEPTPLEHILEEEAIHKIHLLSVDTEGSELDVLESMDLKKHDPEVIIVEYVTHKKTRFDAILYLEDRDYVAEVIKGSNYIMRKRDMKL